MRPSRLVTLLLLLPAASCGGRDDVQEVRDCFAAYKTAVLQREGEAALAQVDDTTVAYYGHLLDTALHANYVEMGKRDILDQLTALQMRLVIPAETLRECTPESLFVEAVRRGIGRESVDGADLGAVFVSGDLATATYLSKGQETPYKYVFTRRGDGWAIDLTSVNLPANQTLNAAIEADGRSANEVIKTLLGAVSGETVTEALWVPVGR